MTYVPKPIVFGTLKLAGLFWETFLGQIATINPRKARQPKIKSIVQVRTLLML